MSGRTAVWLPPSNPVRTRPRTRTLPVIILASWLISLVAGCSSPAADVNTPHALKTPTAHAPAASPTSTAAQGQESDPDVQAWLMAQRMSLDDKLGQLIVMQFTDTTYTSAQAQMVQPFHPGGVILYGYAMGSADQVRGLIGGAQHDSPIPMLTFTDLEGGVVDRLLPYTGPHMSAPDMAASGNPQVAEQQGKKAGRDLLSLGFNADLAPDVDVAVVIGPDQWGRTFGSTPQPVITYAGAWLNGLQSAGVVGCIKHFPGLGAATTDAHKDLPVINRSLSELQSTELAPYAALIASGQVDMVMSTDELVPALDPKMPAEMSKPIITGILRNQLRFNGVAVTDALYMAGITDHWSFAQAAVLAIEAGNDMIMAPWQPTMIADILAGLKQAISSGQLSMAQVNASVQRILSLKIRYHLLPAWRTLPSRGQRVLSPDAEAVAWRRAV